MKVIKETRNELLKRNEVELVLESDSNPGNALAVEQVAKQFNVPAENVALKNVKGSFGSKSFIVVANVYDSVETKNMTEPRKKEKKK